jgi:hypothetical protein
MQDYVSELPKQIAILPGILLTFCLENFPHPKKGCQSLGEFSTGAERHLPRRFHGGKVQQIF